MKKELLYFNIDNCYGGNQYWFYNPITRFAGCAALASCDLCIYLSLFSNLNHLYPYNTTSLQKVDYIKFSKTMQKYLYPKINGISTLELYIDKFKNYLEFTQDNQVNMTPFYATNPLEEGIKVLINQIDKELPVPFLLLRHHDKSLYDFSWHWFLIVGYEKSTDDILVKVATYGKYYWFSLRHLWESGFDNKGGMILIDLNN